MQINVVSSPYVHRWDRAQVLCQHPFLMKRVFLIHDLNIVYIQSLVFFVIIIIIGHLAVTCIYY